MADGLPAVAKALLETIAGPESSGAYDVIYGGSRFSDYSDHPRQFVTITSGPNKGQKSSAAGKYQFLGSTWDDQAGKLGLTDFSPASQDRAAWNLAQEEYRRDTGRSLQADLEAGDLSRVAPSLRNQWTSMPGGIEQGISGSAFANAYAGNMGRPAPAVAAINNAAPQSQPAVMRSAKPASSGWGNPLAFVRQVGGQIGVPIMAAASSPQVRQAAIGSMVGSLGGRTAIARALMAQNIGSAPSVQQGHIGGGTRAVSVGQGGTAPVTLMRAPDAPSQSFDAQTHPHMNMDVYRANAAILGAGGFNQASINNALAAGKTLYRNA